MSISHLLNRRWTLLPKPVMLIWKRSLERLLDYYDTHRGELSLFVPKLFVFFIVLNTACYWLAILTAYPEEVFGNETWECFLMQFPVGILGAMFDTASFFITIYIARRALRTTSTLQYIAHLSVDILIAIVATWWVVFVFTFSGWLVAMLQHSPDTLAEQVSNYENRVVDAVKNPAKTENLKNIYFGAVMGISAMLPTVTHAAMSLRAIAQYTKKTAWAKRLRF